MSDARLGCHVAHRDRFETYAEQCLKTVDHVREADVLTPTASREDCWTLSLVLAPEARGLPPALSAMLSCRGLTAQVDRRDQAWLVRAFEA